jgi:LmbE family N-acetylglucosaminyl deacetylase
MAEKLSLRAIFAHPDDEAFGTGGVLSKYAHEGVEVHLVMATLGEVGQVANPAIQLTQPIGVLREQELRRACAHYGLQQLHLLGFIDGQTTVAPQSLAVLKIVKLLRQYRPQVVISFGPDGIYGHYDHLAVHRWATAAVQLAGQADCWPEAGPVHQVAKFYHRAVPQEAILSIEKTTGRSSVPIDGVPFPFVGYPWGKITTIIDVRNYVQHKLRGVRSHASQIAPDSPYLQENFDLDSFPWFWQESFILAYCREDIRPVLSANGKEIDLFSGVR